jgi:glycosyltransferase involved in cell wall biosynthesis
MRLKNDFDVVFNYNTLVSGYYAAKKFKLPMVYDLADDLPEMIANSPQIPRIIRLFGGQIGKYMLKKNILISKKATCISKILRDSYYIPNEKFELVPNGVDTRLFKRCKSNLKKELKLEDCFVLGYVGVLREWVDLRPVYNAIRNLNDVKLLIVGEEGMLRENKELIRKYRVEDKVIFTGTVPYTKVPLYISAMDICLIPFKQNAISQNAIPLKLFEYLACEKPVISADLKGVREVVGNRILYANTGQEYTDCIKTLMKSPEFVNELGKRGREFVVEKYEWSKIAEKLEEIIGGVVFEDISTKLAF